MDAKFPREGPDTRKPLGKLTDAKEGWEWTVYDDETWTFVKTIEVQRYPYPVPQRFKTEQEFRRALREFNDIRWHITDPEELDEFINMLVEDHWPYDPSNYLPPE
tara:strand:+ start:243 stop:557 length:315 start_codon:yes stop_codon:yes gene_type:complete